MCKSEYKHGRESLLTVFQFTDLTVLLLQFLTDPLHGDVVAQRLGHLVDHLGGRVTRCPEVVTLDMRQKSDLTAL